MNEEAMAKLQALEQVLQGIGKAAIAVSGGVDSMTLACVAQRTLGPASAMFHAISPAVPPEATARLRRYAAQQGWCLYLLDAGEFSDENYLHNPVERCFYCKNNLYKAIRQRTPATLVSGANLDDLSDYRPGLHAARQHGVRHPLLEAGIDKAMVRAIARLLELTDLAELPAAPCLSSRVETGIRIQPAMLRLIHRIERLLAEQLQPRTVRCRIRHQGIAVELDQDSLTAFHAVDRGALVNAIERLCRQGGYESFLGVERYRTGSAFVHGRTDA